MLGSLGQIDIEASARSSKGTIKYADLYVLCYGPHPEETEYPCGLRIWVYFCVKKACSIYRLILSAGAHVRLYVCVYFFIDRVLRRQLLALGEYIAFLSSARFKLWFEGSAPS